MTSKLGMPSRRTNARRRAVDRRFLHRFARANTSISAVMARQLRFGGNGTRNFHIAEDAVLPPALQSKMTLVE